MICRRSLIAALLVLTLASCVDDAAAPADAIGLPRNPALEQLLVEADAAMASGALADAGRKLDDARRLSPDNPDLWVATARLRFRGGEHFSAIEAADRALKLGPRHAPAVLLRALMVRDAHGPEAALPWFEAALAAAPDNADVWAEYAANLGDSGRGRAMLRAVRKLAAIAPEDPRVFYFQAVLAARGGNPALARSLLVRSGLAKREVPAAMQLDAVLSMAEGNFDSAAATLESVSARQPANARVRELLARALLAGGREAELIARFGVEAQRSETSPYLIMLVARAHERLGNRAAAAPLLARAYGGAGRAPTVLADRPGLPPPTAAMRRAASLGNWGAAQDQAQALRDRFPASADVASLAGDAMLGAGDSRAALEAYSLASRARRPWPLTRKIVFAVRSAGDGMAADTLLARHVAGEPNALTANAELTEALAARGDWKRAALLIDHGIALGAGHDPALLTLRIRAARALNRPADARRFAMLLAEIRPRSLTHW
jgi:Tfp pilus assembly protein PilF